MEPLKLSFPGEPKAIQSVRFAKIGDHVRTYQPKANTDWKTYICKTARIQLPPRWMALDCPVAIDAEFLFAPPQSMRKGQLESIVAGNPVFKTTRPDLTDNLMKGLIDALTGVIWRDDALICAVRSVKRYALKPMINITVSIPDNTMTQETLNLS